MNNNPKISVIVPVYNAEKYLHQCIDSILAQDFTDFELLLIDDGSKDKSGEICDNYAKQNKHVKVFHKKNGGVSIARNLGIDHAQGEYIAFIDSDDYVDSNYLSILMKGTPADLVVTGYVKLGDGRNSGSDCIKNKYSYTTCFYTVKQFQSCLPPILDDITMRSPWDKLFKSNIIKYYRIYFDSLIRMAEDAVFVQTYLLHCQSISFQTGFPYHYRVGIDNNSLFKYSLSSKEYIYTLRIILQAYDKVSRCFNLSNQDFHQIYHSNTNRLMLILFFRGVSKNSFTLKGYMDYKRTMNILLPEVSFSDRLYVLCYKLLKNKRFLLSFFLLKFIYPLKAYFNK